MKRECYILSVGLVLLPIYNGSHVDTVYDQKVKRISLTHMRYMSFA
jgi:hypothetical protein